jgi:hypothetical protein
MAPQNKVEEKSLSTSIEFTYQKSPGLFSFIKKMQIDLISLICVFAIMGVSAYVYFYRIDASSTLKTVQTKVTNYQTSYDSLKIEIKTVDGIKVTSFN